MHKIYYVALFIIFTLQAYASTESFTSYKFCTYEKYTEKYSDCTDFNRPGKFEIDVGENTLSFSFRSNNFWLDITGYDIKANSGDTTVIVRGTYKGDNYTAAIKNSTVWFKLNKQWQYTFYNVTETENNYTYSTDFYKYNFGTRNYNFKNSTTCDYDNQSETFDKNCQTRFYYEPFNYTITSKIQNSKFILNLNNYMVMAVDSVTEGTSKIGEHTIWFLGKVKYLDKKYKDLPLTSSIIVMTDNWVNQTFGNGTTLISFNENAIAPNYNAYDFKFESITYNLQSLQFCNYNEKSNKYNSNCKDDNHSNVPLTISSNVKDDILAIWITANDSTLYFMTVNNASYSKNDDGENIIVYEGYIVSKIGDSGNGFFVIGKNYLNIQLNRKYLIKSTENTLNNSNASFVSGSGVAIAPNIIITNTHVVKDLSAISFYLDGKIIEFDKAYNVAQVSEDILDFAILKVDGAKLNSCPISYAEPKLGADIYVYGYPQIDLQGTDLKVTKGIVSGKNGLKGDKSMFQIDAAIQPGNSGGPVVYNNKIIGLATLYLIDSQNANFAVKSSKIKSFLDFYEIKPKATTNDFSKCTYLIKGQ